MSGVYNPIARTLWTLAGSGLGTTLSGAGSADSEVIDITSITDLWLAVYVVGTATGTTPTLDVQIDVQDPAGNWLAQVAKITQLTSGPNYSTVSCGLHIASTGSMVLPATCRVTWTLGGTSPVFPQTAISLVGR